MARYFLDSSALVKRYVREQGTDWLVALVDGRETIVVSRLSLIETAATVARRTKGGDVDPEDAKNLLNTLQEEFRIRFEVVELGTAILNRALDLVRIHALRANDAIQLASALVAAKPDEAFRMVSSDLELIAAAGHEQLEVLDPAHLN